MSWNNEHKNPGNIERGRILTDLYDQVLVGEAEDEVLIWQRGGDIWQDSPKNNGF